jgi:hypothetical protein
MEDNVDETAFDGLARSVASEGSRRKVVKAFLGSGVAAAAAAFGLAGADAKGDGNTRLRGRCSSRKQCQKGRACNQIHKGKYDDGSRRCCGNRGSSCRDHPDCCLFLQCNGGRCD